MTIVDVTATLPRHPTKRYKDRTLSKVRGIIIHHSGAPATRPEPIARYHVGRGWPGIGYHFVIAPDGTVYRTQPLTTVSNHVENANTAHIGICVLGSFEDTPPTPAAIKSLDALVRDLLVGRAWYVKGHREVTPTQCPGRTLAAIVQTSIGQPRPPGPPPFGTVRSIT